MKILKIIPISVVALALPVAAYAQGRGIDRQKEKETTATDIEKRKAEEKQYKNSLSNITTKEYDPWAGVREKEPAKKPPPVAKKEAACSPGRAISRANSPRSVLSPLSIFEFMPGFC